MIFIERRNFLWARAQNYLKIAAVLGAVVCGAAYYKKNTV